MVKVHLGSGKELKPQPWINIDFNYVAKVPEGFTYVDHNLTQGLPDNLTDIDYIYSCHFWEHLTFGEGVTLMFDCLKRMKEGATFRICVPDFNKTAVALLKDDIDFFEEISYAMPNNQIMEAVNYSIYGEGHKCMYTGPFLSFIMKKLGFKDVKIVGYDPTIDPNCATRKKYSVVLEGMK